jgi:hypothetical protein
VFRGGQVKTLVGRIEPDVQRESDDIDRVDVVHTVDWFNRESSIESQKVTFLGR